MLGQAHEFFELFETRDGGGLVLGQQELVFVEELEHLLEGDDVVRHEGKDALLRGTLVCLGFVDLLCELGGALEDGLVGVELRAVRT